jgi:biopolymer transport protein ExbB/TolQ
MIITLLMFFLIFIMGLVTGGIAMFRMVGWRISKLEQLYSNELQSRKELESQQIADDRVMRESLQKEANARAYAPIARAREEANRKITLAEKKVKKATELAKSDIQEMRERLDKMRRQEAVTAKPSPKCGCGHEKAWHPNGMGACKWRKWSAERRIAMSCDCPNYIP